MALFSQLKFKSLFLGPHSSEVWLQRTLLGFFCSLKELEYHSGPPTQCKKNPHWTYTHNRASFLVEKGFESERVIMAVRRRDPFKMHPIRIESLQSFLLFKSGSLQKWKPSYTNLGRTESHQNFPWISYLTGSFAKMFRISNKELKLEQIHK